MCGNKSPTPLTLTVTLKALQPQLVQEMATWGLCGDEYVDEPDHWSPQLYVREANRPNPDPDPNPNPKPNTKGFESRNQSCPRQI